MKKRTLSILACLIAMTPSVIQAKDCCLPDYRPLEPICDPCGIYTQYGGVQLDCGWNVFAWGEFLYWRPVLENAWGTIRAENTDTFGTPLLGSTQKEIANKFGYRPGFTVGIGMHLPCFDDWMLTAAYTRYHNDFSRTDHATLPAALASTTAAGTPLVVPMYSRIKTKYDLGFDDVCLGVQRPNYFGQRVILSPFLGLKWVHIKQKYTQDCDNFLTAVVDSAVATIRHDGIGISAGVNGNWLLCWNLRFIGKADVGLIYPYHHKFSQITTFTPIPLIVELKQHDRHLDILARGGMGLGWGSYFCCNRYHIDISATFDLLSDVVKLSFTTGTMEGTSFLLMGLALRGQFDF